MREEIRRRLVWIKLYKQTGDAGLVCRRCGISRPTLRKWLKRYEAHGEEGLVSRSRRPQTNGSVERLNQTIEDEFYKVAFRKKLYKSLEEIQADLDEFMAYYNNERTNQGRHCQGRTPVETFMEGLELYERYVHENNLEEKEVMQQTVMDLNRKANCKCNYRSGHIRIDKF